ncbi:MAG: hypothetical protein O7D91_21440 [Planctomycetota bacterium]|nr:hypothetical protein [Planctomycetota bacterium]
MSICRNPDGTLAFDAGQLCTSCGGSFPGCGCCIDDPPIETFIKMFTGMQSSTNCTQPDCNAISTQVWEMQQTNDCEWEGTDDLPCVQPWRRVVKLELCDTGDHRIRLELYLGTELLEFVSPTITGLLLCDGFIVSFTLAQVVQNQWMSFCTTGGYGPLDTIVEVWFSTPPP